ncbi:MAG TPA: rhomboid family intramembrane serine protease, partial [Candidatus Polarisedimenticolia bacterium]|nr:rhomboid family intramembrane serine protease [Candidatus Polarisedimenticolia bacterium]
MDVKVGPVLTYLSCAVCVMIFFKAAGMTEPHTWESLSSIGYFPAELIWEGKYLGLWSSVFVHLSFWHLAFNLYWLWLFGSAIELNAGRIVWIALFLLSGGVSSSAQLAASGETGLGASGVAY